MLLFLDVSRAYSENPNYPLTVWYYMKLAIVWLVYYKRGGSLQNVSVFCMIYLLVDAGLVSDFVYNSWKNSSVIVYRIAQVHVRIRPVNRRFAKPQQTGKKSSLNVA